MCLLSVPSGLLINIVIKIYFRWDGDTMEPFLLYFCRSDNTAKTIAKFTIFYMLKKFPLQDIFPLLRAYH